MIKKRWGQRGYRWKEDVVREKFITCKAFSVKVQPSPSKRCDRKKGKTIRECGKKKDWAL